jgi:hypothetical protein
MKEKGFVTVDEALVPFSVCNLNGEVKRTRWAGYLARIGDKSSAYELLVAKAGGKRSQGRPRCRCVIILNWVLK